MAQRQPKTQSTDPEQTQYLKLGSDRPDVVLCLQHADGEPVDLSGASGAQLRVHAPDGTTVIDAAASVAGPFDGLVEYDVSADELTDAVTYRVEVRVDWSNGDEQWFPVEYDAYELSVVPPPAARADNVGGEPETYGDSTYGEATYGGST